MTILDIAWERNPDALIMDGFDDCVIGVTNTGLFVHSEDKIIRKLMADSEIDYAEAVEFYEYNQARAYVGDNGPIFMEEIDANV